VGRWLSAHCLSCWGKRRMSQMSSGRSEVEEWAMRRRTKGCPQSSSKGFLGRSLRWVRVLDKRQGQAVWLVAVLGGTGPLHVTRGLGPAWSIHLMPSVQDNCWVITETKWICCSVEGTPNRGMIWARRALISHFSLFGRGGKHLIPPCESVYHGKAVFLLADGGPCG
jgi:hypothetical protein